RSSITLALKHRLQGNSSIHHRGRQIESNTTRRRTCNLRGEGNAFRGCRRGAARAANGPARPRTWDQPVMSGGEAPNAAKRRSATSAIAWVSPSGRSPTQTPPNPPRRQFIHETFTAQPSERGVERTRRSPPDRGPAGGRAAFG